MQAVIIQTIPRPRSYNMTVLGELAQRLKTDLADTARASVDPVFSRQLTEANFRDKELERQRKAALLARQQAVADKEKQQKFDIQKTILFGAHKTALDDTSGKVVSPGWINFMKLGASGKLEPPVQEAWGIMAEGVGQRSADANKQMFQQVLDLDKAMREKTEHNFSPEKRAENEIIDTKWSEDYKAAQDISSAQNFNRQASIDHLRSTYGVFQEAEKDEIISRMASATSDQEAKEIYINSFDAANNRYQSKRGVLAFPERFTNPVPWLTPDGKRIGTKQRGPDGKFVYTRDVQSPLVSMGAGKQADLVFDDFKAAAEGARFAEKTINNIGFIEATIGDMETGTLTDMKVSLGQLAASFNLPFNENEIGSLLGARTAAGEMVMAGLNNFPGQISNQERIFLEGRMPALTQTKEGRQIIMDLLRRGAEETIARRQMMEPYIRRPEPTFFPEGEKSFFQAWDEYRAENPLWQDIPTPNGTVIANPNTQILFYESLDGNFRDKEGNLWDAQ